MRIADIEITLREAAFISAPPRSVVDDVMDQLVNVESEPIRGRRWRHAWLAAGIALTSVAALLAVFLFLAGPSVRLTLGDVQSAFKQQQWVHIRYDAGQIKDEWINLRSGEFYATRFDGDVVYCDDKSNTRLWYSKLGDVIHQDVPTIYPPGQIPPVWTPQSAWDQFVAPFARAAASTRTGSSKCEVLSAPETLDGNVLVRFDGYGVDSLGKRLLFSRLWADPRTRLPVRVKHRLQLAEREQSGKEWSTGDYDFPASGPADLSALGVPHDAPIARQTVASGEVQAIFDGIRKSRDQFIKNYRVIVIQLPAGSMGCTFDVIWRDGEKLRQDNYCTSVDESGHLAQPPFPAVTPAALVAWSAGRQPFWKQLMDSQHEFIWSSARSRNAPRPGVQVMRRHHIPLLASNQWPEEMQWPIANRMPECHQLENNGETPANCVGLRYGGEGNQREDYYVDPANDYVCIKEIDWQKQGNAWVETRVVTLSDLHRVEGRVVAGIQEINCPATSTQRYPTYEKHSINLMPLRTADFPEGLFDPSRLTTGADVEGY